MATPLANLALHVERTKHALQQQGRWAGDDHHARQGVRNGQSISVTPSSQSRAAARANAPKVQAAHATVPLTNRRVGAEQPIQPMSAGQIAHLMALYNIPKSEVAGMARQAMSGHHFGTVNARGRGGRNGTAQLLAYHAALLGLDDDDAQQTARLSPIGRVDENPEELARRFQQAEDPEALEDLLEPLRQMGVALPRGDALWDELVSLRDQPQALMKWLGARLALPLTGDIKSRRQAIQDQLEDFCRSPAGRSALGAINVQDVARGTSDPAAFASTYVDLLEQPEEPDYTAQLLWMLNRCSFDQLDQTIGELQTGLAVDMNEVNPSINPELLHKKVRDIGELRLSATLVSLLGDLKGQIDRYQSRHGGRPLDATVMLKELLVLIARRDRDANSYLQYPKKLGVTDVSASIVLLRGVHEIVRSLPPKCFPDDRTWVEIRDAIGEALDRLTVEEEEQAMRAESRLVH